MMVWVKTETLKALRAEFFNTLSQQQKKYISLIIKVVYN
jgi:hypothetical protein